MIKPDDMTFETVYFERKDLVAEPKKAAVLEKLNTEQDDDIHDEMKDKDSRVKMKIDELQEDVQDLDNEIQHRHQKVMGILNGDDANKETEKAVKKVDIELQQLISQAEASKAMALKETEDLKARHKDLLEEVQMHKEQFNQLVKAQDLLENKVSSKSNEHVDIKPGKTIEDVYVSLRTRGRMLKGQGSPDAPILKADQKVHLLPERSVRVIKEFLVDLEDHDTPEIKKLKEENKALKQEGEQAYQKIKDQHIRDKLIGSPSENLVKESLDNYQKMHQSMKNACKESNQQLEPM